MSTTSDINPRPARRSRRNPKATPDLSDSQLVQASSNNPSYQQVSGTNFQPTQILSRKAPDMTASAGHELSLNEQNPSTPPRHPQTPQNVIQKGNKVNGSEKGAGAKHQKSTKSQGTQQKAAPKTNPNETMGSTQRPNTLTPGRDNATPSRAYAGPTFHASPAASSLPMPKLFSRSVPNVNKTASLKHMMEQSAPGSVSENEDSPFMDKSDPSPSRQVREESPLDIFFQADRKAKADRALSTPRSGLMPSMIAQGHGNRPDISPSRSRNHSRHPTDGSGGGIFPIELETHRPDSGTRSSPSPHPFPSQQHPYDRSLSAPLGGLTNHQTPEQRRHTQTIALKKMLFAERPPGCTESMGRDAPPSESEQSSAATNVAPPQVRHSHTNGDSTVHDAQRKAALLALAHKQIADSSYSSHRPGSSGLSKELAADHTRLHVSESNSTLIPNHASNNRETSRMPYKTSDLEKNPTRHDTQDLPPEPSNQMGLAAKHNSMTAKSMEDDLRRILKLEVQHSANAT